LAGQVVEVHTATSKIILLTDSNCKVGVIVQRSRVRGVVQGNDEGGCMLKFLEATADVKNGDILLSSDNSLIYPSGLPVGVVGEIKSKPGTLFKWATVLPATDFARLEEVAIIAPPVSEPAPEGNSVIE
jgi:rod shape-determining protein MreC